MTVWIVTEQATNKVLHVCQTEKLAQSWLVGNGPRRVMTAHVVETDR